MLKKCNKCGESLPATLEYFSAKSKNSNALYSICRKCKAKSTKEYRKKNPLSKEKVKIKNDKYRNEHIDYYKNYSATHKDQAKQWRENNKNKIKEYREKENKKQKRKSLQTHKKTNQTSKVFLINYDVYLSTEHWQEFRQKIYIQRNKRCELCDRYLNLSYHVHHLTYKHKWFERDEDVMLLCNECHMAVHGIA